MAHFTELNENNVVLRVIVVHNNELLDADGVEQESLGQAFCTNLLGGTWKQTSYNGNMRKTYAGIGFTYDPVLDEFNAPVETPLVETLLVETPSVETPLTETLPVETLPVETPLVETPLVETPLVETPLVETPPVETPPV